MPNVTDAVYELLAADSSIVSRLAMHAGQPAIFTSQRIPPRAARPYIWTWGAAADEPDDTKDLRGRTVTRDIWIVADSTGSEAFIETLAEDVRNLFHRSVITLDSGTSTWSVTASGPVPGPVDDQDVSTARIVTVRMRW